MDIARTAAAPSLGARITRWRAALAETLARRADYDRTLFELRALSDRELADLGVRRSDIPRLARESVYGPHPSGRG